MKKLTLPLIAIMCLMLVLPALATAKKPLQNHVEILYVDKDNSNTVIASAEFLPEGPGSYVLDNQSPVIIENLPQGYELLEGNHYVINVHEDGIPSPDTVKFKVQTATPETTPEPTITPAPTAEPTATPAPTAEPSATPVPTAEPTATPVPTAEPTATPAPTVEPTATPAPTAEPTATPAPTAEPTATPAPTAEPTATPAPTATPRPTAKPTASPAPGSGNVDYDTPKSGSPSVLFTAIATMAAAAALIKRR